MASTVVLTTPILQLQTGVITFALVDDLGNGIDVSAIETLILTYYDLLSQKIINARQAQDVHNANSVTLTTVIGPPLVTTVTWTLGPLDTILVDPRHELEQHIALFEWAWAGGSRHDAHEIQFGIEQLTYVV